MHTQLTSRDVGLIWGFITTAVATVDEGPHKWELQSLLTKWIMLVYVGDVGGDIGSCFAITPQPRVIPEGEPKCSA